MNTQHTPGPLHIEKFGGRYEIWPKDNGQVHTFVGITQREPDAKLFAAAPDLLKACQAIIALLDGSQPKDIPGALMVAQSAIAKATGL